MDKPPTNSLKSFSALIERTIPVLSKHPGAWWQLIALLMAGAIAAAIFNIGAKLEPNKAIETLRAPTGMKRPSDDCIVKDGAFLDKMGDCW